MTFNIVRADLTKGSLALVPAVASSSPPLQPLTSIASDHPRTLAAINGGYFWRVDDSTFVDNVCWTKTKEQALLPPGPEHRSCGVGDSAVVINSTIIATNCEDPGYARPAALVCDGAKSSVVVMHRGELLPPGTSYAIAAGPNLVSSSDSSANSSFIDIPLDDFNVNIWEHASNTAGACARAQLCAAIDKWTVGLVGQAGDANSVVFAVADGHDGVRACPPSAPSTISRMAVPFEGLDLRDNGTSNGLFYEGTCLVCCLQRLLIADAGLRRRAPSDGDGPGGQQVIAVNYESTAPHFHILFILLNIVTLEQHDVGSRSRSCLQPLSVLLHLVSVIFPIIS